MATSQDQILRAAVIELEYEVYAIKRGDKRIKESTQGLSDLEKTTRKLMAECDSCNNPEKMIISMRELRIFRVRCFCDMLDIAMSWEKRKAIGFFCDVFEAWDGWVKDLEATHPIPSDAFSADGFPEELTDRVYAIFASA